jgi:hypothetical protein
LRVRPDELFLQRQEIPLQVKQEWLVSVAQRVAEAPYGKDEQVSAGELAAIERLRELLS